ncbi:hypothetical protein M011DRAFT_393400 [Sporormia fimetaria CBS 119925]|uniref:Cell polarity protein-like protein n=1 Tax=Sporormia fimetaria CBS 119925 TaxID=1340428 RepID=A0A6A6VR18_9PLEO|nr:hypothetical protein M011DRAFT_393400 [Sporormia fimetaria CBS 119925]
MSFLFGKKSKQPQGNALPPATREISSSHGPGSQIPGPAAGGRDPEKGRGQPPQMTTPGTSVNNSLNSLHDPNAATGRKSRERSDSDHQGSRGPRNPQDSPYPWSSRRLNFTTSANPFPRYGAAINSTASKDGIIYIMGGLVAGTTVKGDLWLTELGNGSMACYPIPTTGDGPGPRVGHASLLVGNAFIVFGGDTKLDDEDDLDDTLYLLNTSTKHWSRALPQGARPTGRYGHTLNILGSKIYIFGGQVEGFFFNDLVAFDLNSLQSSSSRWEVLLPNTKDGSVSSPQHRAPPPRTNHSVVTWEDKLYLFGGTDGVRWFNDVWTYDPRSNSWTELDCIGYIPVAREGHSATLVNDTMYIFGGRTQEGLDLGDLAAFRISSRRWYMFHNMGHSPSARSGHSMTAFGKHVVVMAGEPSASSSDRNELSLAYILDTSKIRYPPNEAAPVQQPHISGSRNVSGDTQNSQQGKPPGGPQQRGQEAMVNGLSAAGSRLPRAAGQAPSGPPPLQQPPQPRTNGPANSATNAVRSRTPTRPDRAHGPPLDTRAASIDRDDVSPVSPLPREVQGPPANDKVTNGPRKASDAGSHQQREPKSSIETSRSGSVTSRNTARSHRQHHSLESVEHGTPRRSIDAQQRELETHPVETSMRTSPPRGQQVDELMRELEAARSRNAWYASELALARKAGYNPGASTNPILDQNAADAFGDDDRPLLEALLKMKSELERVQNSIEAQGDDAAKKIAEIEKQRDAAINEAIYAKTKLAAHGGGSQVGTPQLDGARDTGTPDLDRTNDIGRRLAVALASQTELTAQIARLQHQIEGECRARQLAEDTAEVAHKRVQELDSSRQQHAAELDGLRAELHEAQRLAREASANASEAEASSRLLAVDKSELSSKLAKATGESQSHAAILQSLRQAVAASSEKSELLEEKFEEERSQREILEQKLAQLRSEHEQRTTELETASRKLHDAEEIAEKYQEEARHHREAVLSGLNKIVERDDDDDDAMDERVVILQQQVEAAKAMVRENQLAADQASEKLRRAEERIAGLEAYQEQTSREGLSIRKQLQQALRDVQASESERSEMRQQYERLQLESNALEVQLKTLKNLLEERGINPVDHRRSRILDSPGSRYGTPELNRVRELEQQIDSMNKAHEELRAVFEQREQDVSKEWEEKLQALTNDHQAAVKYLRGTEKMLSKMKQELDRYKNLNQKLEDELVRTREASDGVTKEQAEEWEAERASLRVQLSSMQANMETTAEKLESQLTKLQKELAEAREEAETADEKFKEANAVASRYHTEIEALHTQNEALEERAREAEQRVQMFLDQFESSVDTYRRQSQVTGHEANGVHGRHRQHDSISGDSLYTDNEGTITPDANDRPSSVVTRNSMALDNLASELDALRSHWETTNKAYRLSNHFEFERTPTSEKSELSESLAQWRKRMDIEDEEQGKADKRESGTDSQLPTPTAATAPKGPAGPGGSAMI